MWSRKGTPVANLPCPEPSRLRRTVICVSRVLRVTSACRMSVGCKTLNRKGMIPFQPDFPLSVNTHEPLLEPGRPRPHPLRTRRTAQDRQFDQAEHQRKPLPAITECADGDPG